MHPCTFVFQALTVYQQIYTREPCMSDYVFVKQLTNWNDDISSIESSRLYLQDSRAKKVMNIFLRYAP